MTTDPNAPKEIDFEEFITNTEPEHPPLPASMRAVSPSVRPPEPVPGQEQRDPVPPPVNETGATEQDPVILNFPWGRYEVRLDLADSETRDILILAAQATQAGDGLAQVSAMIDQIFGPQTSAKYRRDQLAWLQKSKEERDGVTASDARSAINGMLNRILTDPDSFLQ